MAILATNDGNLEISDSMLWAIERQAAAVADLTGKALRRLFTDQDDYPLRFPRAMLLELGAAIQVLEWELRGIAAHTESGLPSYAEASREIVERLFEGPTSFMNDSSTPLSEAMLRLWTDRFAWDGELLMGGDFLVDGDFEEQFLDRIADFFWSHRDELEDILDDPSGEEVKGDN